MKGIKHMKLWISIDNLEVIKWCVVDVSYNVHVDCRGQTGAMMSSGKEAPISRSSKQKLNMQALQRESW